MRSKIENILFILFLFGTIGITTLVAVGIDLTPPSVLYLKR